MEHILNIKNLHTYFYTEDSVVKAVEGLNLSVRKGEALGLVGESACGKSVTASSVMRLIQPPGKIVNGEIIFEGRDLLKLNSKEMQHLRGNQISLIFQEPFMALNPVYRIGFQIGEAIGFDRKKVLDLLERVGISEPKSRINDYPHNLSGGQAQRVVIAAALACEPKLIIADEPTTSLDVTIQAQIMELLLKLKREGNFTFILITHNLALCSEVVDRIAIMYSGRIVELASTEEIFKHPLHPYTRALFSSIPKGDCYRVEGAYMRPLQVIEGSVPDPANKPSGCHFNPRCPMKKENCLTQYPGYKEIRPGHWVSCHYANAD